LLDLTLEVTFETVIQQNEKLKKRNSKVPRTKKFKVLIDRFFPFPHKT